MRIEIVISRTVFPLLYLFANFSRTQIVNSQHTYYSNTLNCINCLSLLKLNKEVSVREIFRPSAELLEFIIIDELTIEAESKAFIECEQTDIVQAKKSLIKQALFSKPLCTLIASAIVLFEYCRLETIRMLFDYIRCVCLFLEAE